MTKHYTIGDKIIKIEKILDYLLLDKLHEDYWKSLDILGFSKSTFEDYKKDKLKEIFK